MKTFLINLPQHDRRRNFVKRQIEECPSMDLEIISGIDGYQMSDEEYNRLTDVDQATHAIGRPLSKSEIGCALSHIQVYKEICTRNLSHALILEDDVIIPPGTDVEHLYRQTRGEDIVMLGVTSNDASLHLGEFRYVRRPSHFNVWGFFAYIVSLASARALVNLFSSKITYPVDSAREIGKQTGLTFGLFLPSIITVDYSLGSYVGPGRSEMKYAIKKT
jgi:glycosyl transferase family 25